MLQSFQIPFPIHEKVLSNGMHVTAVYRKGFKRMSAQLAFPFGSLHQQLQNDLGQKRAIPAGTAHFLEHQLFKQADGSSISDAFAALGAYDNAFTNFDHTVYMADCSENQAEVLRLLLQYTDQPYFETESVENEKEIIIQELMMYRDQPEERLEINLRQGLYGKHPAGEDIGGTEDTVRCVTPDLLYACYDAYYKPSLARLVVVADLPPEEVFALAETWGNYQSMGNSPIWPTSADQAGEVTEYSLSARAARPLIGIGFGDYRSTPQSGPVLLRRQMELDLLLDILLGRSSAFYWQLMDEQLFGSSFQAEYHTTPYFGAINVGADSLNPVELKDRLVSYLNSPHLEQIIHSEALTRLKKKTLGELLSAFESSEELAINLVTAGLYGYRFTDIPNQLQEITEMDLINVYRELLLNRTPVLSYVFPDKSEVANSSNNDEINE
jgi:predicted Zn-dependent peptidase